MHDSSTIRTYPLSIDVSHLLPFEGQQVMAGWLVGPAQLRAGSVPTLVYCIAGGGGAATAFDLEVPGFDGLSFARYLAALGHLVAAFDHPGVGSSTPVPDLYRLDVGTVAKAHAHVVARLKHEVHTGAISVDLSAADDLRVVGLGHSMGGMVLDVVQARQRSFDAVVVLGHGGSGLPEVLAPDELALVGTSGPTLDEAIVGLARARFADDSTVPKRMPAHGVFFGDDVPKELMAAMGEHQAELLYHCALQTLIPGSIAAEMAAIDVPVFLGLGDRDLIHEPHAVVASYSGASDVTLFVLPGAGHNQFQAGNRFVLWDRIVQWIAGLSSP